MRIELCQIRIRKYRIGGSEELNALDQSFSSTTYGKCARRLDNAYTLASENIFAEIHREIKNVYENGAEITDLSVSFDGTWLTRGHTSLIGVGCVIDMLTGYVVDFEVMSKGVVIALWQKIS
ncbi:uncharacterized protein TNCV_1000091 [Trichonephila clavipes]|nr:uncharacterized protein TNCV_1000091 [Trichonephila clavipes]